MKIAAVALAASIVLLAVAPSAWAAADALPDVGAPTGPAPAAPAATPSRSEQLDALFATLKSAKDATAAKRAEDGILAIWIRSGSDTVDLLMAWSAQALAEKNYAGALAILDRVVTLKPDYAEGWNERATVYYLTDEYGQSVSDIEHVLALEPRHFGALVGLGSIFRALGDDTRAIAAYQQALALDPQLDNARKALDELEKETGRNI